jgi:hypothetical protein
MAALAAARPTPAGVSGQGGSHRKNMLHGDVWLVGGEQHGGGNRRLLAARC